MSSEIRSGWVLFWIALALAFATIDIVYGTENDELATDRYVLERTEDGFVRMDRQTGEMSVCREQSGSLVCRSAADDRTVIDAELEALKRENAELRRVNEILKSAAHFFGAETSHPR